MLRKEIRPCVYADHLLVVLRLADSRLLEFFLGQFGVQWFICLVKTS